MAVELTGTAVAITWASGADPAGQSITVPTDATAVYMFWSYWRNNDGDGLASATLGGNAPDETHEETTDSSGLTAAGVCAWYGPPTGSQTLDLAWDGAPDEGPTTIVVFVKGGSTSAWRDADSGHTTGSDAISVTLDSNTTDLVLKYDQRYDSLDGTPPSTSSGWTSIETQDNGDEASRLSYADSPGASSTACAAEDENYSSLVAISIPEDTGGGGGGTILPQIIQHYYGGPA